MTTGGRDQIRIGVLEDDAGLRKLLAVYLGAEPDFTITFLARDGHDGLARVAHLDVDVVVLDLTMPRVDGWAVAAALRHGRPDTKIVVYTGGPVDPERAGHVDAVVQKGAPIDTLVGALREVTARRTTSAAGSEPRRHRRARRHSASGSGAWSSRRDL